ncbi:hypothetical protein AVEN_9512-1 [Araneus ventricosus]|uniref:Uncharacterized protein n=1 Tax=Araneus ventricosus TaxID=182803 RepID=A0A4Y2Q921_ARAVE|nr:hypothetical protein AVEN_9512-1 [Araneus ventricosus]
MLNLCSAICIVVTEYNFSGSPSKSLICTHNFMQDGAPTHIKFSVQDVAKNQFTEELVISLHFNYQWPPPSPEPNLCGVWLWGNLEHLSDDFDADGDKTSNSSELGIDPTFKELAVALTTRPSGTS